MATKSYRADAELRQVQRAVKWASSELELSTEEVGQALGASPRSVARWKEADHRPSGRHVQAAEKLLELAHALSDVFGRDMERLHKWLHEPLPALRGRSPLRKILEGQIDDVLVIVANADTGAFL